MMDKKINSTRTVAPWRERERAREREKERKQASPAIWYSFAAFLPRTHRTNCIYHPQQNMTLLSCIVSSAPCHSTYTDKLRIL